VDAFENLHAAIEKLQQLAGRTIDPATWFLTLINAVSRTATMTHPSVEPEGCLAEPGASRRERFER
jgi:hypothetical protein